MSSKRSDPNTLIVFPTSFSTTIHGNPNAPASTSSIASAFILSLFSVEADIWTVEGVKE